jgi:hypothetical protein
MAMAAVGEQGAKKSLGRLAGAFYLAASSSVCSTGERSSITERIDILSPIYFI